MYFSTNASPTPSAQTHSFPSHYSTFDYISPIDLSAAVIRHLGRRFHRATGMPHIVPDGTRLPEGETAFQRLGPRRTPQRRRSYERVRPYPNQYCTCDPLRQYPPGALFICRTCGGWTDMAQYQYQYQEQNYFPLAGAADEIPREQPYYQVPYGYYGGEAYHREDYPQRHQSASSYAATGRGFPERGQYVDYAYADVFDAGREPPFPRADEQPGYYYAGNRAVGYADGPPIPRAEYGPFPGANERFPLQGQDWQHGTRRHHSADRGNVRRRNNTAGTGRRNSGWDTRLVALGGGRGYFERRRRR